ncbi:MAG: ABC transporter substrate-binding protein [Candidatus Rokubacteria bacterium]|nr:ABC transporter substrate-binding protein [Candidatus Rokubacteria bacterium]
MHSVAALFAAALLLASAPHAAAQPKITVSHGLSMHGDLKYGPGFKHFEYANPNAPKGGDVRLAAIGTFDTLNPFILKGVAAAGLGEIFETLTTSSADEPFAQYGLIAETIEMPADRAWVAYTLRPEVRFHDGSPITPDDVVWTFETLKSKGHPFFRAYYAQVAKAERIGERKVKFSFGKGDNRELPLIIGQMAVLSRAYWSTRDFEKTTLEPPLGSGAYRVESVEAGRSITYRRVKDYWGAGLPVNAGRDNFDTIRFDYYRDTTVALEAFKAGQYDFRQENVAKNWATAYTGPAVAQGLIRKEEIRNQVPTGMQAYVFNQRRPIFQDPRVRQALAYAFDFEWTNKQLFYGAYTRTKSYFSNSELASQGLPGSEELKILQPFRGKIPEEVFTREYQPPATDGSGNIRDNVREALRLLAAAGWTVKGQRLVNDRGEPLQFEILGNDPTFERIALPFAKNLERLGAAARVRTVDTAQYQNRLDTFDFDMTTFVWGQSLSPGNEQHDFWHSETANIPGSRNLAGIKSPVVDALIDLVIRAPDRPSLVARTRALDRVLLWGHYVIPHWHIQAYRVAYWDKFGRPAVAPKYALGFDTWWVDPKKEAEPARRRGSQ